MTHAKRRRTTGLALLCCVTLGAVLGISHCAPQPSPAAPASPTASASASPSPSASAAAPPAASSAAPVLAQAADAGSPVAHADGGLLPDADRLAEVMALQARLLVVDGVVGTGAEAKDGDHVAVHVVGTLADGTVFQTTRAKGKKPLRFVVGDTTVPLGLSEGVGGMRVGGHRTLTVPPALGYGSRGLGKKVPPGATLSYDVELVSVKSP